MEPLHFEAQTDSPEVYLDNEKKIFRIEGNSFADDPVPYYLPIFDWLERYKKNPNLETVFEFKLNYINTASTKQVANVLMKLEELKDLTNVKVKWYYQEDDEDMFDEGNSLKTMINLDFDFIEHND